MLFIFFAIAVLSLWVGTWLKISLPLLGNQAYSELFSLSLPLFNVAKKQFNTFKNTSFYKGYNIKNRFVKLFSLLLLFLSVYLLGVITTISDMISIKAKELYEVINKKGGGGSSNTFSAVDFITDMQNYFASLSFVELTASINILGCVIILLCLSTIILILLSDYLINKLNISSNNFPRIYKFLLLRRKIQLYSLIVDFSIIVVVVLTLIYINIIAMT